MVYRKRSVLFFISIVLLLFFCNGCFIFDLFYTPPEFSVSGARVVVMPFRGPNSWYGEGRKERSVMVQTTGILREGGAEICYDKTIYNKVVNFTGTGMPAWVLYGKQVKADYVVVGWLTKWKIGDSKAINYVPGSASMQIQIYDVEEGKLAYEKNDITAKVGQKELDSMFHSSKEKTEKQLMESLIRQTAKIFIGSTNNLD